MNVNSGSPFQGQPGQFPQYQQYPATQMASPPLKCSQGHELCLTQDTQGYFSTDTFICNQCTSKHPPAEGRKTCKTCKYNLCLNCVRQMQAALNLSFNQLKCSNNHHLSLTKDTEGYFSTDTILCEKCLRKFPPGEGRRCCKTCKYNICLNCAREIQLHFVSLSFLQMKCYNNHDLVLTKDTQGFYSTDTIFCEKCLTSFPPASGRKCCNTCKYYLCLNCVKQIQPTILNQCYFRLECTKGHSLILSKDTDGFFSTDTILCEKCMDIFPPDKGRNGCKTCKYYLCLKCAKEIQCHLDMPFLNFHCQHNHELKLSSDTQGFFSTDTIICESCFAISKPSDGRHECKTCKYYLCLNCYKEIQNKRNFGQPLFIPMNFQNPPNFQPGFQQNVPNMPNYQQPQFPVQQNNMYGQPFPQLNPQMNNPVPNPQPIIQPNVQQFQPPQEFPKPHMQVVDLFHCAQGHELILTNNPQGYSNERYTCNKCMKSDFCANGRRNCLNCKYDLCLQCIGSNHSLPPQYSGSNPVQSSIPLHFRQCKNGHVLQLSNSYIGYHGNGFSCGNCKQNHSSESRFSCLQCKYDICLNCRPMNMI